MRLYRLHKLKEIFEMILTTNELKKLAQRIKPVNERLNKINKLAKVTIDGDVNLVLNDIILCYFHCFNPNDMEFLLLGEYNGVQIMPLLIEFYNSVHKILNDIKEEK